MINIHEERLKMKLALFLCPGFNQVMSDLKNYLGDGVDIMSHINSLKRRYTRELEDILQGKPKFKQIKLPL